MKAATRPLHIEARSKWVFTFRWGTGRPLNPYNLSGYTGFGEIRNPRTAELVSLINVAISNAAGGEVTLTLPTTNLPAGVYEYDVFLKPSSDAPRKILKGPATIHPSWSVAP